MKKKLLAMILFLSCILFLGESMYPHAVLADPIYIDASGGTPVVWSPSPFYWNTVPFDGLHSSVTQIAPGAWAIDIGVVGAFRGWGNIYGLELTDPQTGSIVDSFGVYQATWNNAYSWTTVYTELYTTNSSGQLAGRYRYANNLPILSESLSLGSPQLAAGFYTEWRTFEIYLIGMAGPALSPNAPIPEPATMLLFGTGIVGLVGSRTRKKK